MSPLVMDLGLRQAHERENPQTAVLVEVGAPDVRQVLRRAEDQFLTTPPLVSQTPANTLSADPAGALTLVSSSAQLARLYNNNQWYDLAQPDDSKLLKGIGWTPDPAFGRGVLRTFTALIERTNHYPVDLCLQIYRAVAKSVQGWTPGATAPVYALEWSFVPLLPNPVIARDADQTWTNDLANVVFDLTQFRLEVGTSTVPAPEQVNGAYTGRTGGELPIYYFVIEPFNYHAPRGYCPRRWRIDNTSARTITGVGTFQERWWQRDDTSNARAWVEGTNPVCECFELDLEAFSATSQAVYQLTLPSTPAAASTGRVVFQVALPTGTSATLELATAGSGGPWTTVKHGDVVATKQTDYWLRLTMNASADGRRAPRVGALGVEFRTPVDVSAESTLQALGHAVDMPYAKAGIGEGQLRLVRTGRRDYRDPGADLVTSAPVSQLEVDVFLGSRHPQLGRDRWLHVDRALVTNRAPSATAEVLPLLSYLKVLQRKIPQRIETINTVHTVVSATTAQVQVTPALTDATSDLAYDGMGYYLRVRQSAQVGVRTGFIQTIDGNTGNDKLDFTTALPGTLAAGDVVEVHSARYTQPTLLWQDADPADVWWEILTTHVGVPAERIGYAGAGRAGRSGLPPKVTDRAPNDAVTQGKLKVTLQLQQEERADALIDQLSFLMGGATVEIAGQIVFRQLYTLRDANNVPVVAPAPSVITFDPRDIATLETPVGLEQRLTSLSCNYGVDTTTVAKDTPPASTVNYVDADALAWLAEQDLQDGGFGVIPDEIARWCYNSVDQGLFLATSLTRQVVLACSTGLRLWPWTTVTAHPELVVGDMVTVITDQYTDYDPTRQLAIRGLWAFALVLTAVEDGGRRFTGFLRGLQDGASVQGGLGTLFTPPFTPGSGATELHGFTFVDSVDGTQRTFRWTRGDLVDTVFVYVRTMRAPVTTDPFDFTTDGPAQILATGTDEITVTKPPSGQQVFLQFEPRQKPPTYVPGIVRRAIVDPAPPALAARIRTLVTNGTADLAIDVAAGASDWPVQVDVFEDDPDGVAIASTSLSAAATLDKSTFPALGARALPLRAARRWYVRLTNVAGVLAWGTAAADRDALPAGTVTASDYRAAPQLASACDDDTDTIRITVPGGTTKTIAVAAGSGGATYTVGDVLDDASTETLLAVDEVRAGYKVEFQGGGAWRTVWEGPLHGTPSNPPTAQPRAVKNASASAEDVYVVVASPVGEALRLYVRDSEDAAAPIYGLVAGAADSTPLYVASGTELGPGSYFVTGTDAPVAKLAAVALTRDQVKRLYVQVEGQHSLVRSSWIPLTLSLQEQPWLESISLTWDEGTGSLRLRARGGAHCVSGLFEVDDNPTFASPNTASAALADGGDVTEIFALTDADRGKTWYGRVTPFNAAAEGGLAGVGQVDEAAVPDVAPSLTVTPTPGTSSYSIAWSGTGVITLSIDGGAYGTPPASPIPVTRDSGDHTYAFKAVSGGQTITQTVTVPALAGSSLIGFGNMHCTKDDTADTITGLWDYGPGDPDSFLFYWREQGTTPWNTSASIAGGARSYQFAPGHDLVSAGTSVTDTWEMYVAALDAGGNVLYNSQVWTFTSKILA